MEREIEAAIEQIHQAPPIGVVAVAGAGSNAAAWLLGVAGASRTLLEVLVPYGRQSMIRFLGREPKQYAAPETAQAMAEAAYRRSLELREETAPVFGLACAAAIATNRPRRGDHRACLALWDASGVSSYNLTLEKGRRDRAGEEDVVSRLLIHLLALGCGVSYEFESSAGPGDELRQEYRAHRDPIARLLEGEFRSVTVYPDGRLAPDERLDATVLPGSFRPLHHGHELLAEAAAAMSGKGVVFELSVANVDKPALSMDEIQRRVGQFRGKARVVLTRAATFRKKAELFPGAAFALGWDTAVRLVDHKYYGNDETAMLTALAEMWALGCRFLVGGRQVNGRFHTLAQVPIPAGFQPLFREIPEAAFRADVSSTFLRANGQG